MPKSDNMRGAVLMMMSMAAFTLNDTFIKSVAGDIPLFQAVFLRGLLTSLLLFGLALHRGVLRTAISRQDWGVIGWRTVGEVSATVAFLTALFHMPIANATSILQSLPLAITLAGAVFFGEPVGWRRYLAIGVGFFGVLLIVRPGSDGFDGYSVFAVIAVGFVVLRDLSTRRLSAKIPSLLVALSGAVSVTILGGVVTLFSDWQPVSSAPLLRLGGASIFLVAGYLFSVMVMRVGEISFVAAFRYTALIWAIVLGIAVFGEVPDLWTLIGSAIVVGTGIYTFYRERRLMRAGKTSGGV
ncbi:MAG: DMT family transporter [Alphaproteobacteria bacterium]|nr:DMT family transporter [Alphaproteobacteria bacterium]